MSTADDLGTLPGTRIERVGLLHCDESYEQTLQRLADLACETIPGCSDGSVTLWRDDKPCTVVSTSAVAQEIDDAQYGSGMGPCLDAVRTGATLRVEELAGDERWPEFAEAATSRGIRSSLSLPLAVRGEPIGALNLYSTEHDGFADADGLGQAFAWQAAVAIANAELYDTTRKLATQLQEALDSRAVIEQAKGVLMAESGCTPKDAFELLRQASQRENVKLRDIAQRIVAGQSRKR